MGCGTYLMSGCTYLASVGDGSPCVASDENDTIEISLEEKFIRFGGGGFMLSCWFTQLGSSNHPGGFASAIGPKYVVLSGQPVQESTQ